MTIKYEIGTKFKPIRKHTYIVTITDRLTTTNDAGDIVKRVYVGTHEVLGQTVTDSDICQTTIDRGIDRYGPIE